MHSGERVKLTLHPAPIDSGITVAWSDGPLEGQSLEASWRHAVETPLCTTLIAGDLKVATVEHLFSALAGCGVDNVRVELSGCEVPIMDGSAAPFVYLIDCAGTQEQDAARRVLKILKPVVLEDGERSETGQGTPQGAVISPLLANVYLHYVFDLWAEVWREKVASGDMIVVRYADDLVAGFQQEKTWKE